MEVVEAMVVQREDGTSMMNGLAKGGGRWSRAVDRLETP